MIGWALVRFRPGSPAFAFTHSSRPCGRIPSFVIRPASSLRGLDQGGYEIFALRFAWAAGMRTSLHKHKGFELVLVRDGRLHAVVDGTRLSAGLGEFIDLPTGSVHAIWSEAEVTFDVLGQSGLGLTMVVPNGRGGGRDSPIYGPDGPGRQRPPECASFPTQAELDQRRALRQLRHHASDGR